MVVISNFYKIILLIILIIILFEIITNFNIEKFNETVANVEGGVKYNIIKSNNILNLEWSDILNKKPNSLEYDYRYIIIIYINNKGPYFDEIDYKGSTETDTPNNKLITYKFIKLKKNNKYKFGVIKIKTDAVTETVYTPIIKEIILSDLDNYSQTKLNNWKRKIECKANGKHTLVDKNICTNTKEIIATNGNNGKFDEYKHEILMKSLNNTNPEKLDIKLNGFESILKYL